MRVNLAFKPAHVCIFLLGVQFCLLAANIDNAFVDGWNLRQAQTAMMTENIKKDGLQFLPTRLDFFAPREGTVILEFPLLHSLTAVTAHFTNWTIERSGRVILILFHIFNLFIIDRILQLYLSKSESIVFTTIFSFTPIVFYTSHAFIPEATLLTFYLAAMYFFLKSLDINHGSNLMFRPVLALLPLIKPLGGQLYFPMLFSSFRNSWKDGVKELGILCICSLPFFMWLLYGVQVNNSDTAPQQSWGAWSSIFLDRGGVIANWFRADFYQNIIVSLTLLNSTPVIVFLCAIGITRNAKSPHGQFYRDWLLICIFFTFVFAGANRGHPYYQIFFVPVIFMLSVLGFQYVVRSMAARKKNGVLAFLLAIQCSLGIGVFLYGTDTESRITNLDEYRRVVSKYVDHGSDDESRYTLIQAENMASGVYDYYIKSYTKQFSVKHHDDPAAALSKEYANGARFLLVVATKYGDSLQIVSNTHSEVKWLSERADVVYESPEITLYQLLGE